MLHPHSSTGHMSWNVDSTGTNLFLQYSSWMLLVELPTEWKSFLLSLKTPWSIPWRFRNPWNPKTTLKIHRGIMWNPWKLTICFPENAGIPPVETLGKSGRNFHRFSQVEPAIAALRTGARFVDVSMIAWAFASTQRATAALMEEATERCGDMRGLYIYVLYITINVIWEIY